MGDYLYKLIEEKKDLERKLQKYNTIIDSSFGKKDYFARKNMYYDKMEDIRKQIKKLSKKIDFALNLSDVLERKSYEEQTGKSYFDF